MSDEDCVGLCYMSLAVFVSAFIFMTVASPGFLLYGFFSGEWLIENRTSLINITDEDSVYYGLYRRCLNDSCSDYVVHELTFGLEVTSVVFQFLAILALPWLKPCIPDTDNKCLKYWNNCFVPFLFIAAIFSLSASIIFADEFASQAPHLSTGKSQLCAGLGGGFQIVLTFFITGFLCYYELLCCQSPPTEYARDYSNQSMAKATFRKTGSFFVAMVSYTSITTMHGNRVTTFEQRQVVAGYEQRMERY